MSRWPKPPEGSWTEAYPELGTAPISYEDSISPEFYELEREAVFKKAWLQVGRVEEVPKKGSYFTKEIHVAKTSVIILNDGEKVRAFHNICRHRGNKLVWQDFPNEETSGTTRQFTCKYHAWRYDLSGGCTFVQQEQEFFDLDKSDYGLVPVHCEVWAGFIFINLSKGEPEQSLKDFLGPMVTNLEGYPFGELTARWKFQSPVKANWKLYMDAFQEFYHAPVLHAKQNPTALSAQLQQVGFEAPHYQIEGPHRVVSTAGIRNWEMDPEMTKGIDWHLRAGLFGKWDKVNIGPMPEGLNPGKVNPWGLDSFNLFPNFVILIWQQSWYLTYNYWPTSYNSHIFEANLYFTPAKTPRERVQQELIVAATKEFALQDANTLEATQTMLESRVLDSFPLCDQEVLCRHLHKTTQDWVDDYTKSKAGTPS